MTAPKPVVLCILDGWGLREETAHNAPAQANTPNFDHLMATCPNNTLITHGPDVGLPTGQMGNSEVGHTNIGAGRVVAMDLGQIDLSIEDGSFFKNEALIEFADKVKATGGTAHIAGLVSPGGVHSHQDHLVAAAKALTDRGLKVAIHAITDGRDVAPQSAREQVAAFQNALPEGAEIVTLSGRYFAMDRDNRWERVSLAYEAIVHGTGTAFSSADAVISAAYNNETTDEFVRPATIGDYAGMQDGDGLFFVNFRADRAREILRAIGEPGFAEFNAGTRPALSALLGMVEYSDAHNGYMTTCFPKRDIVNTLAEWVAKQGKTQFHTAETEKYPHVTFFLNGGKEDPVEGEVRYMAASPKVATYDLQPEMSAPEVTEHFVEAIEAGYDLIVTNYANPDMVGHTGDLQAAMAACEAVDEGLGQVIAALEKVGGAMIVTADHGNCETMWDEETNGPHTAHTTNLVPVILFGGPDGAELGHGRLADLAPTLLELMGLPKPDEMTGESLIK
ncbi:2,3-bisphosphoglycerate-independent phosphoglycerate mutase [Aliiroseovarius sp. KMU-50]|uniref:2,3-bisphosphoglycerate-independent phosphoglycerate mutase n=1 Tax=Aliiroseovarius salicola TaxID=3009082 RepID=A0ABT4VX04_9RHOB|nr:2,3-bisphosphoglycerate-independent phosphoglycerate mutase [Aliiroseovarius sp. KMU-50]MDA5092767.1 2,3-bisphosphoglycerate-independent phosphoglycerate mutase [Aliiroseovarius sp. KMU-50]